MFKRLLSITSLVFILAGCATTHQFPMRSAVGPTSRISKSSAVHIDGLRDTEIEYRRAFYTCDEIAKNAGLKVSEFNKAQFILYLNFTPNIGYNAVKDTFESVTETPYSTPGVINVGAFVIGQTENKPEWEGSISIKNLENTNEVDQALSSLFSKFAENFKGEA